MNSIHSVLRPLFALLTGLALGSLCARAADPQSILWRDNFDDGLPLASKYEDLHTSLGLSVSTADAFNGTASLQQDLPGLVWVKG